MSNFSLFYSLFFKYFENKVCELIYTFSHIYAHYHNIKGTFLDGHSDVVIAKLQNFLNEQQAWLDKMVLANRNDSLWRNVGLIVSQYRGLVAGYDYVAPKDMVGISSLKICSLELLF